MSREVTVLHVDDEQNFVEMGARFLEREDGQFTVETATSAREGLDRLDDEIDCIVSDYDMPRQNGIEFLEAVRKRYPDLPFILFTGKGSEEVASDAIQAGATDYLQKYSGGQFELLANRIRNAVAQYRATRAERHLRELAESTDRILYIFTHDWSELLFVSPAYEEIWGRSIDTLRENPTDFLNGIHPEDREFVQQNMQQMSAGESITIEYRVNPAEDYSRWVRVRGEPITDATGDVVRVAGFATEITEEKHREQEIEHQRSVFESIVETVPHGILVVDQNREFFTYNQEFVEMWEIPEEIVEAGDDQQALDSVLDQLADPEEFIEQVEYFYDHPEEESRDLIELSDGRVFQRYTAPVRTADESPFGRIWIFQDITTQIERERELERQKDLFEQAQSIADIGVWEADLESGEGWWSEQVSRIYGLPPDYDPRIGEGIEYFHPEDRPEIERAFEQAVSDGESYDLELRLRPEDGSLRWVRAQADSQFEEGELVRVRGTLQDITQRKTREQELERQNERLDEFASVVSHDLRNPLSVAEGQLELLQAECDSDRLDRIERALDRSQALIENLLTLAREGERVGEKEPVDLATLSERCWDNIETGQATLEAEIDRTIRADPSRLQQALQNLMENAITHGGDDVSLTIGELASGFYVADDGPGIPPGERDQVFDSGYSTSAEGTGFGLSIVREIVEAHGWAIRVTESSDGGARFEITSIS